MNQRFYRNCAICHSHDYVCSVPIKIYFTPNSEKEVNFNLVCEVKRKTLPLTLNVKAEGYSMNCLVLCEDLSGNKVELTSSGLNAINFGEVSTWPRFIHTDEVRLHSHLAELDRVKEWEQMGFMFTGVGGYPWYHVLSGRWVSLVPGPFPGGIFLVPGSFYVWGGVGYV